MFGDPKSTVSFLADADDLLDEASFELFPNPISSQLTLKLNDEIGECTVSIYSIEGKLIRQYPVEGITMKFNLGDLSAGEYILQLATKRAKGSKAFIKY